MTAVSAAPAVTGHVPLPPPIPLPRRILKHPLLMHHNRLLVAVLAVNLLVLGWLGGTVSLAGLSNAALANFTLAIIIRQQYVINLLFRLATRTGTRWPLKVRWTLAKVYHFGGLHVGGAVAGTFWYLAATASLTGDVLRNPDPRLLAALTASYAAVALLLGMVVTAVPPLRARRHDRFEKTHRYGGWAALVLLWVQTVLLQSSGVWVLAVLTVSIALPWLRLRRVRIDVERPSAHVAVVRFDHGVTPFAGSSTAVSRDPLREWHSFANVPSPGQAGFRLTISRAGDWTGSFIDDAPTHVWVKGITTAGVANIETLFTSVVYVATGSGIGPVLPHLLAKRVPARLVWSARSPRETYGDAFVDEILAAEPDATIWDTAERGKPDMVRLAYAAYLLSGAEAVICISNKKLTWQVVHSLERRGIPAYGAIWDS